MRLVATRTVEILLEHEFAVPGDQQAVDLQGVQRIHRHVDEHLHELFDRWARDADVLECRDRPGVVELEGRSIAIAGRRIAMRIERTARGVRDPGEVVRAAAEGQGDHPVLVMALHQRRVGAATAWSDEPDVVAIHVDPLRPREPSRVALGIAEICPQGAIGLARDREIEGQAVVEGRDRAAPTTTKIRYERDRRRGAPLDPMSVPERAFAVGEVEGKGSGTITAHGDSEAGEIGAPSFRCPIDDERAAGVGAEAQRSAPQSRDIWWRLSSRVRGEREQQADGQAGWFHSGRRLATVRGARDAWGPKRLWLAASPLTQSSRTRATICHLPQSVSRTHRPPPQLTDGSSSRPSSSELRASPSGCSRHGGPGCASYRAKRRSPPCCVRYRRTSSLTRPSTPPRRGRSCFRRGGRPAFAVLPPPRKSFSARNPSRAAPSE